MTAGYSGTPLARKLGIKAGHRVSLINAPPGFESRLEGLLEGVALERASPDAPLHEADVTLIFVTSVAELAKGVEALAPAMPAHAALWVAWPKKASGVRTDMTEDRVRDIALPRGLVDNKVCAVDGTWSGLRLVVRKEHRADWPAAFVASAGRA